MKKTQPNYWAADLARVRVPVTVVQREHDGCIKREHAEYLAKSTPRAQLRSLADVSHFAPLQRPEHFNSEVLAFLGAVRASGGFDRTADCW